MNDVTRILSDIEHGDPQAAERLLPLVEVYHLLAAAHARRAPDVVVVLVACLPVVVLGCAVALMHLLRSDDEPTERAASSQWRTQPIAQANST